MSEHDTTIKEIDNYNKRAAFAAMPGNFFVEFFPWMMYIPERLYIRFFIYPLLILTVSGD